MPGMPPARVQWSSLPARLGGPCRDAAVPLFRLWFRKRLRVPALVSQVRSDRPTSRGVSSPGAQSFAQGAARAHTWAGTHSLSPPAREAGSQPFPGLRLPPGDSGSFSAKVEAHASIGEVFVTSCCR